jgi:glycosyltransferase involved in cell wall biosynthesis
LAAAVTAPSRYLLEKMQPYRSDLLLLPNPIEIQKYKYISRKEPQPVLIWLRAFHVIYNAPLAIHTLALLVSDYPSCRLLMGGDDKGDGSFQKVRQLIDEISISDKVEIFGKIPHADVPTWLQRGDIFINTTNVDNTPVSVLEAMACGLCIISTNVGGIPYLLNNEQDALLVSPNDPESMASAVRRILTDPGLAERLSTNARRKAEQLDWSVILLQWENLFREIIEG